MSASNLSCSVCDTPYGWNIDDPATPVNLVCGHSYCRGCLLKWEKRERITCPHCKKMTHSPARHLARNLEVVKLVQEARTAKEDEADPGVERLVESISAAPQPTVWMKMTHSAKFRELLYEYSRANEANPKRHWVSSPAWREFKTVNADAFRDELRVFQRNGFNGGAKEFEVLAMSNARYLARKPQPSVPQVLADVGSAVHSASVLAFNGLRSAIQSSSFFNQPNAAPQSAPAPPPVVPPPVVPPLVVPPPVATVASVLEPPPPPVATVAIAELVPEPEPVVPEPVEPEPVVPEPLPATVDCLTDALHDLSVNEFADWVYTCPRCRDHACACCQICKMPACNCSDICDVCFLLSATCECKANRKNLAKIKR